MREKKGSRTLLKTHSFKDTKFLIKENYSQLHCLLLCFPNVWRITTASWSKSTGCPFQFSHFHVYFDVFRMFLRDIIWLQDYPPKNGQCVFLFFANFFGMLEPIRINSIIDASRQCASNQTTNCKFIETLKQLAPENRNCMCQ